MSEYIYMHDGYDVSCHVIYGLKQFAMRSCQMRTLASRYMAEYAR